MSALCRLFSLVLPLYCSIPEERMTTMELITYAGYPVQQVEATTKDGYILTMFRIPYGRNEHPSSSAPSSPRPAVLLQHGLLASSADWVLNLPEQSLGFLLADSGCDVYLGNVRGNHYSRGHVNDTEGKRDEKAFWAFSFDEMAAFDLEAMVDEIRRRSQTDYVYYVGYSQGTMMMFARLARDNGEFSRKIKKFFALAPVGRVAHASGPIVSIGKDFLPEIELFIKLFGENQFLPSSVLMQFITRNACGAKSRFNPMCSNLLFALVGPNTNQMNTSRLAAYLEHSPAGTSTQNILHWAQMTRSGLSQMYDYGSKGANVMHYGQTWPPLYDFSNITVPTYLFHSPPDILADPRDVEYLVQTIPENTIRANIQLTDFNHIDFVYGLRAADEIYSKIIEEIKDHESNVVRAR